MIRRAVDYAAFAVLAIGMAAVSVIGLGLALASDVVAGRRHAGRVLDSAHIDENGDRLPIGDDERVRMLVHKEWL